MSPNCPNCGADLTGVLTETSTTTPRHSRKKLGVAATNPPPHHANPTEANLHPLKQLMCFPFATSFQWKPTQPTMRPVLSDKEDEVGRLTDTRARQTLDSVARKMHATIRAFGEQSADALLESRQRGRTKQDLSVPMYTVFEAVGAIIYAMEWTSDDEQAVKEPVSAPAGAGAVPTPTVMGPFEPGYVLEPPSETLFGSGWELRPLLELMLVIDYGFPARPICGPICGPLFVPSTWFINSAWSMLESFSDFLVQIARLWRWRQGLPNNDSWGLIAEATCDWAHDIGLRLPVWDVATMIYYYCTHRQPVEAKERKEGWTGYTGVLQEMIAEVPTRGTDRLERKLSLDAHILIPRFFKSRKLPTQMLLIAQDLATKHGCQLAPPEMPRPSLWRRLFGKTSPQQGSRDGEKGHEDMKVIEDVKVIEDMKVIEGVSVKSEGSGLEDSAADKGVKQRLDAHESG